MKYKKILILLLIIIIVTVLISIYMLNKNNKKEFIREPKVAGSFYPFDKEELSNMIDFFLENSKDKSQLSKPFAFVLPHAGYNFSGQVAVDGLKYLKNEDIKTVVILGNSHQDYFKGASVFKTGYYKTPLGKVRVNSDLANKIIGLSENIQYIPNVHKNEHSIEVQIPLLQKIIDNNFEIVPIVFGNYRDNSYKIIADFLSQNYKRGMIFIASSDLSHYPNKELAQKLDRKTIDAILKGNIDNFNQTLSLKDEYKNVLTLACGSDAIKTIMIINNNLSGQSELLQYKNSFDFNKDSSRLVGYSSIGFFIDDKIDISLNKQQKDKLLNIAKISVEKSVKNENIPTFDITDPFLEKHLGAFVTIKKNDQLRGCIGVFSPTSKSLFKVVKDMAVAAAKHDTRFVPVSQEELPNLDYEISVLSFMKEIGSLDEIVLGKHGVYIEKGKNSGVFLPQVATDNSWDKKTFLSNLCLHKAGLSNDCYKDKDATIKIFTAQVFE